MDLADEGGVDLKVLTRKAKAYDDLVEALGYVGNASDCQVAISQDDATRTYIVRVGPFRKYWGDDLPDALAKAAADTGAL